MAIKKRRLAKIVLGVARRKSTAEHALSRGALDVVLFDASKGVRNADLVILCAPVGTILKQLKEIAPHLKRGCLVIDVGSTKKKVLEAAKKHLKGISFVGCHPMAGSEKSGVEFADADLFENSVCYVTAKNSRADGFWKALGAAPQLISADTHDRLVAKSSHLPHALAFSLLQSGTDLPAVSNPSLRNMARLAKSNPELWAEIFLTNQKPFLKALRSLQKNMNSLANAIASGNAKKICQFIAKANAVASKR